jgi:hypothetical protein
MPLTRDQILASRPRTVAVNRPELGGDVLIKPLSVAALGSFLEKKETLTGPQALASLVALSACDEDGKLLFGEADSESLAGLSFETVQAIADEVMKLNGIGEGGAKNS